MPGLLDEYRRMQAWNSLGRMAQGLLQAGSQGMGFGSGLAYGLGQGGGGQTDPAMMVQLSELDRERQERQERQKAYQGLLRQYQQGNRTQALEAGGGPTPQAAGLLRDPTLNPEQAAFLRAAGPEAGMGVLGEQLFREPEKRKIVKGADGFNYYADTGERVLPGVERYETPDRNLIEIYDPNSPTGTRLVRRPEAAGQPGKPATSLMSITGYDDAGRPLISVGGRQGFPGGMQKKTVTDIEGDIRDATEGLARLVDIQRQFQPEYQTLPFRWSQIASAWEEKAGGSLSPENQQALADYSAYKRDSVDNLNRYIKEITGAQMSIQEAERIIKGLPNPGTGLFDGDSPTEFRSKMEATIRSLRKATARYVYSKRNGLDPLAMQMGDIEKIMNDRQQEIEQEVRASNPDISDEAMRAILIQQLGKEFGLIF